MMVQAQLDAPLDAHRSLVDVADEDLEPDEATSAQETRPTRPSSAQSPVRRPSSALAAPRRQRPKSAQAACRATEADGDLARRTSIATSSTRTGSSSRPLGSSAWQPYISGGIHASYTRIGRPQLAPQLGTRTDRGSSSSLPWTFEEVGRGDMEAKIDSVPYKKDGDRKMTLCPFLRGHGVCRLPRCPFIHEPCRPVSEHWPLYNCRAPTKLSDVLCRFVVVLGACPYADVCPYNHEPKPVQEGWRKRLSFRRPSCDKTARTKPPAGPAVALRSQTRMLRRASSSSLEEPPEESPPVDAVSEATPEEVKAPSAAPHPAPPPTSAGKSKARPGNKTKGVAKRL
mmetsp:Transcript_44898/g.106558  ORF Transcript_44898/g.106558 Transcript_44898/m.106558 type:complete len:342 (+) Transcript_44898:100-1125(+)